MKSLEDGYGVAESCKVSRAGESRGTGADYGNADTVFFDFRSFRDCVSIVIIRDEALKPSYSDGLALNAADAF